MDENLGALVTETQNLQYAKLDTFNTLEIIKAMNEEDKKVALAVEKEIPNIAKAIDKIVEAFKKGGRLFYIGAGTSGRLGVLDASECPPTFGVSPDMVQAIMAGGERAYIKALEGSEDDPKLGKEDLLARNITANDVVVGVAASGRTPYVIGALEAANQKGATTVAVVCNPDSLLTKVAEITIALVVGPEVLTGSTRLKAGTAQKMVLNMLSTAAMIQLGKVYGNLMVDVQMTNAKLVDRAIRIVTKATGVSADLAERTLQEAGSCKVAIVMLLANVDADKARKLLKETEGLVRKAVEIAKKE